MVQRFIESFRSTEGYEMKVICKSASLPHPESVRWFKVKEFGDEITLSPVLVSQFAVFLYCFYQLIYSHFQRTETTNITGDTLVFTEVKMSDSGSYICNTSSVVDGLFDSSVAEVKIKSE